MNSNFSDYNRILELYKDAHSDTIPDTVAMNNPVTRRKFRSKFRKFEHIRHTGSQVQETFGAHLLEEAYRVWMAVRNFWDRFTQWLYPRRDDIIWGTRNDSPLVGRITFAQREDQFKGIHHMHLEVWGRTWWGSWRKFSEGDTDEHGKFSLPLDMMACHAYALRNLRLEIYNTGEFVSHGEKHIHDNTLFKIIKIKKSSIVGLRYSLGTIQLFYWEYRRDTRLPRVTFREDGQDKPEDYPDGRIDAISEQFIPIEMITRKQLRHSHHSTIDIDDLQSHYPTNLTTYMENKWEGVTRSDEWFGMRMMNGIYTCTFDRDPKRPDLFWVHYHWSSYSAKDTPYIMPDVSMWFRLNEKGYMIPVEIEINSKFRAGDTAPSRRSFTPADGEDWEAAKRIARVGSALLAQVDKHFAETHANVEQYAVAAMRNIRRNPIGAILYPHIKEVTLINHTADRILIGKDGWISKTSGLSAEGLAQRVLDVMGTLDWKNWRPMQPLSDAHTYARAGNLFWDVVWQFVEEFIELHTEEIKDEWHEIFAMSRDLMAHSVDQYMCNYLKSQLKPEEVLAGECPLPEWYNQSGRMDLTISRLKENHNRLALSKLTSRDKDPTAEDLQNLQEMTTYIIWQATFGHYWANSKQYDDIGELKYSTLGMRLGDSEKGILSDEDDVSILPDIENCIHTMWWANMLSRTGYGFIIKNEDGDVHPRFIELLKEREKEFAALDVDIYAIPSRTNI